ncbi:MAG TPA: hypothetical protein VMM59_10880 [Thermohalobaculum sp.]|nr:hypothetical protein [Thermohalobaculum sp.]
MPAARMGLCGCWPGRATRLPRSTGLRGVLIGRARLLPMLVIAPGAVRIGLG